ncbi:ATP-binding cassette sub-family A member 13 [Drosophila grimshawi]|uniref:GH11841 n=1 Tax=Drosophila grimshawi TaxID=7222 RepID=B4JIN8_DROGR|nr:ATP-binding cassette sub-family A member 13 [Drosophila grimshawi]XP_032594398.1 ATP-binding cassette sub-family A member 13 [Drosophila grimshawi]EDW00485.1 GH11841 [Drosophila grimshawi]
MSFRKSEVRALLRKDVLVRWRQKGLALTQILFPVLIFMMLYLIRLKYGSESLDACQFPTRLLPTKNQVVPSSFSYICSIENKCLCTDPYEEYSKWEAAPLHNVIDVANVFVTDDRLYNAVLELPEKANFVGAVTTLVTSKYFDLIRNNIGEIISLVPEIERLMNYSFDISKLFSNRETFVKLGVLLCGHPFPSTESIPLVNDILYSEDFSEINDDELQAMPTKYCKRLYLDVTSTNQGKLTWNFVKPIIQGKILYTPSNADTDSIVKFTNGTFEEMDRLKKLSKATAAVLGKLRTNATFQDAFENLLKLARSPLVKSLVGDDFDIEEIERIMNYVRSNKLIYEVFSTISDLLECLSVDRFIPVENVEQLQHRAFKLNQQRLFMAALNFESVAGEHITYRLHMDTDNTQPTFENKNRFWFPGPAGSMLVDLKYHRGFVQLMQMVDLGIIKHKRQELGPVEEPESDRSTRPLISVQRVDDEDDLFDEEDDFDQDLNSSVEGTTFPPEDTTLSEQDAETTTEQETTPAQETIPAQESTISTIRPELHSNSEMDEPGERVRRQELFDLQKASDTRESGARFKRQGLLDLLSSFGSGSDDSEGMKFNVDDMQFYTKQFPYPAYVSDDFKRGLYLAQAVQVAYCVGLVIAVAICVRERIWMRESRNSMLMRSMGLHAHSELVAWILMSFMELLVIFVLISIVLYSGGILAFTNWFFMMFYCLVFGACLISFCYMCSNFFISANIGAVATSLLFFITLCPYIIVLLFDAKLNLLQNFLVDLSFTTAFAKGWSELMRMELQEQGLTLGQLFHLGPAGSECALAFLMFILDTMLYAAIGFGYQRYKKNNYSFVRVTRAQLDAKLGASLSSVTKMYGNKYAISNLSVDFARNQVSCLLGRNGAGKSTLIKLLTGQTVQTTGQVFLAGEHNVGVCWQDNILIPKLTAREHLELYAQLKLDPSNSREQANAANEVRQTLDSLNFGKHENYYAYQLSGGYRRRLCVALAFIASPSVVILDEPCNGVDAKARKDIWHLIEQLRQGRAVIFATHFLDEAKYLSDALFIMRNGRIVGQHSRESLHRLCTSDYSIEMHCMDANASATIVQQAQQLLSNSHSLAGKQPGDLIISASYAENLTPSAVQFLELLQTQETAGIISDLALSSSSSLEQEFEQLNSSVNASLNLQGATNTSSIVTGPADVTDEPPSFGTQFSLLLGKRRRHLMRNYRLLLYVLLLPAIFEVCAMWFVSYRLEDDFDTVLPLSRDLYPHTAQMLSQERLTRFTDHLYDNLMTDCDKDFGCSEFNSSRHAFYWMLNSLDEYRGRRYGGYGLNGTGATVWYNNKGYHAMVAWLNDLNTHLLRTSLNSTDYDIRALNEPWKLGYAELSTSSVLRQAGDSCMVFILLIAFGLVVAAGSVYLVNERINGEKLQQRLSGVSAATYWLVAFLWDYLVMVLALIVCLAIVLMFNMPVFVDRQQLSGIVGLSLMFSFACVPAVHVVEKIFSDSSIAIVSIFCANIIIPLVTMGIVLILGVVGDGPSWDSWRHGLNNAFLIFPQHALGDGLLELCKNYMAAVVFKRYDIDSYRVPLASDLLSRHFTALAIVGIVCVLLNLLIELHLLSRMWHQVTSFFDWQYRRELRKLGQLKLVSIQSIMKSCVSAGEALRVDNLWLAYRRGRYAVRQVHFAVHHGECFGLLGKNGAGKSTIFKLLTGQLLPNVGQIYFEHPSISYCPQSNPLDPLLTVKECIQLYGQLRGIKQLDQLLERILDTYELRSYRDVQVKRLSGGNRRKLTVAISCCGYTPTILMDEPTSDMDPVTRSFVYRTIEQLLAARRAVLLTSHSISEIEHLCQRVAVLKDGKIVASNSPAQLKAQHGGYYAISCFCAPIQQAALAKMLPQRLPSACDLQHHSHSLRFLVKIRQQANSSNGSSGSSGSSFKQPTLAELFDTVRDMAASLQVPVNFSISRCRFDAVFERILDNSEATTNGASDLPSKSAAVSGTLETGYVHCGFEETMT